MPGLEAAGFLLHVREPDWHQHRFFRDHDPEAQIHVFAVGSQEAERMLLFRDRLRRTGRSGPGTRSEAATRRQELDADSVYADAKSDVVEAIIARAATGA